MNDALRQTGRTTRTIEEAVKLAECGHAVYVLAASSGVAKYLERRIDDLWNTQPRRRASGIKVEVLDLDHFDFDWTACRYKHAHSNCRFLLDHTLVEQHIERLRKEIKWRAEMIGQLYPKTV